MVFRDSRPPQNARTLVWKKSIGHDLVKAAEATKKARRPAACATEKKKATANAAKASPTDEQVPNVLLTLLLFRGWFNSRDHYVSFVVRYASAGAATIQCDCSSGVVAKSFSAARFVQAAVGVEVGGTSKKKGTARNSSYNPGSYGVAKVQPPEVQGLRDD